MSKRITIVGAGLVGSLLGTVLAKRGYQVRIFERRPDMRTAAGYAGRSINLAMSDRGLRALETAGLADDIRAIAIPMHGRMMHDKQGVQTYQPYGKEGQFINSVSRGDLNKVLMTAAERHGVEIVFNARCTDLDVETATATFELASGEQISAEADVLFGADGAFSAVRGKLQTRDRLQGTPHSA
jgi:kynurenine 3-monooxygenase